MDGINSNNLHSWLRLNLTKLRIQLIGSPISALKLYDLGYKILAASFVIAIIFVKSPDYSARVIPFIMGFCALAWFIAFCVEAASLIPKAASNKYFIFALAVVSVPVVKFSSVWIGRFINNATGADPGELPDAVSALLVIFIPITWLYVAIAMLVATLFFMLTAGTVLSLISSTSARSRALIARLLIAAAIVSYGFLFADRIKSATREISILTIVAAEYFKDGRCRNLTADDVVAHLESGLSVYNKKTKTFKFEICQQ